ncbi:hypothetical protein KPH14_002080 [Odynerus spinipes]|uniref:Uncharacterized protein n=1 Tax=Odynerus spinipes TaxID=1348599 RepID=A0AAD9RM03_9HYME|nr:hypothetical protein KPH14_002080 [Odynerus spinipes]
MRDVNLQSRFLAFSSQLGSSSRTRDLSIAVARRETKDKSNIACRNRNTLGFEDEDSGATGGALISQKIRNNQVACRLLFVPSPERKKNTIGVVLEITQVSKVHGTRVALLSS